MGAWVGLVPALLVVLYAGWCGNLLGGVTAAGSTAALAALLLVVAALSGPWRDPLRLGRLGRLVPLGLWVAVAASAWLSPAPRAGLEAVVLLPAYVLVPGAVARCWEGDAARRLGARGMAAAVALLAAWALAAERGEAAGGFAPTGIMGAATAAGGRPLAPGFGATLAPLGHHTLLAAWLVTLLPVALLPLRERNAWRWLGAGAGALGIAAVLAGGSLAGGVALAGEALAVAWWLASRSTAAGPPALPQHGAVGAAAVVSHGAVAPGVAFGRRSRRRLAVALAAVGLLLAASQLPRLARIASRQDVSSLARAVYLRAGWQGWRERPWLGWGPGSVPWTAAWFMVPRPGINPWGEAVGELHSLPVQLAYEIGALGLLAALATGGAFLARRWPERRTAADPGLLVAGCLGLAGAGAAWLGTAAIAVAALPLALAAAAGAALAGGRPDGETGPPPAPVRWRGMASFYALLAAAVLLAPEVARWHYDRAVAAGQAGEQPAVRSELAAAVRNDPELPLYRLRLALVQDGGALSPGAAGLAWRAARDARGIGLLWLVAGILGHARGEAWAPSAFEQSCVLDPLSPFPPFYLMASAPDAAAAPRLGARALLAEPRLMAATFWEGREPLFRQALEEMRRWPGVDAGWKLAMLRAAPAPADRHGAVVRLELIVDAGAYTQASTLHLFRRRPWPVRWQLIRLRQGVAELVRLPPAFSLRSTKSAPVAPDGCSGG